MSLPNDEIRGFVPLDDEEDEELEENGFVALDDDEPDPYISAQLPNKGFIPFDDELTTDLIKAVPLPEGSEQAVREATQKLPPFLQKIIEAEPAIKEGMEDVLTQAYIGRAKGAITAPGNLLSLLGFDETTLTPGEEERLDAQYETLDKINRGEKVNFSEISDIADDDILPMIRLPTSQVFEQTLGQFLPEPKTVFGRVAKRVGEIRGGQEIVGMNAPAAAFYGGTLGQLGEEAELDPLAQVGLEIAGMIFGAGKDAPLAFTNRELQNKVNTLRAMGYKDEQITTAINAAKSEYRRRFAKGTSRSKKIIQSTKQKSDELVESILMEQFPELGLGSEKMFENARTLYGNMKKYASQFPINKPKAFVDEATSIINDFKDKVQPLPGSQEASLVKEIESLIKKMSRRTVKKGKARVGVNPTAEELVSANQKLNQLGKWTSADFRDNILKRLKKANKQALGDIDSTLLEMFDEANTGIRRAYQAENVSNLIEKTRTAEGAVNWNKFKTMVDNAKNRKTLEQTLGPKAASNLYQIAKVGKDVTNLQRNFGDLMRYIDVGSKAASIALYAYNQDFRSLVPLIGVEMAGRLSARYMTDPKLQSIILRGLNGLKRQSYPTLERSINALNRYIEEEMEEEEKGGFIPLE